MKQSEFLHPLLPLAQKAGEAFRINPVVILAQAAIESGWGQSTLAVEHHNYFGITAYGRPNVWWKGEGIELGAHSLRFRVYDSPADSFMDYARLVRSAYPFAADASNDAKTFARKISQSKYISEVNGDNRAAYQALLVKISKKSKNNFIHDTFQDPLFGFFQRHAVLQGLLHRHDRICLDNRIFKRIRNARFLYGRTVLFGYGISFQFFHTLNFLFPNIQSQIINHKS